MSDPRPPRLTVGVVTLMAAAVVASALLLAARDRAPAFHGTPYDGLPAPDFTLTSHEGSPFALRELRGRPVLLFFGFTHCPDVCPTTLDRLTRAVEDAGRRADDTAILLVTVDPERDTPEALARYVGAFGDRVVGLTGDEAALEGVLRAYGVHVAPPASTGQEHGHGHGHGEAAAGAIAHSSAVYGIDRAGVLRVVIPYEHPEAWIGDDVRALSRL